MQVLPPAGTKTREWQVVGATMVVTSAGLRDWPLVILTVLLPLPGRRFDRVRYLGFRVWGLGSDVWTIRGLRVEG